MKYRREIQEDGESKLRLVTSTAKVPDVISYLKKKNPNEKNTDIPADIIVTNLNSASKEYSKWLALTYFALIQYQFWFAFHIFQ